MCSKTMNDYDDDIDFDNNKSKRLQSFNNYIQKYNNNIKNI